MCYALYFLQDIINHLHDGFKGFIIHSTHFPDILNFRLKNIFKCCYIIHVGELSMKKENIVLPKY